jgi:hypothetical protein
LGGRYDVGLDNRIMPEVAARVLRCRLQPRKITPAVRVLQEAHFREWPEKRLSDLILIRTGCGDEGIDIFLPDAHKGDVHAVGP